MREASEAILIAENQKEVASKILKKFNSTA